MVEDEVDTVVVDSVEIVEVDSVDEEDTVEDSKTVLTVEPVSACEANVVVLDVEDEALEFPSSEEEDDVSSV